MRRSDKATGPLMLAAVLLIPGTLPGVRSADPPPDGGEVSTEQRPVAGGSGQVADTAAPTVTCAAPDGKWHPANVALRCTATDAVGLVDVRDAAFDLATTVEDGAENAAAATTSRQVCDAAGNCATAGPIGGNRVDRKAPEIKIAVPGEGASYGLFTEQTVRYECLDGGSGIAECTGEQDEGSRLRTGISRLGDRTFTIVAIDEVGHKRKTVRPYKVEPVAMPDQGASPAQKPPKD